MSAENSVISCPICAKSVLERHINQHIDSGCQTLIIEATTTSGNVNPNSVNDQKKKRSFAVFETPAATTTTTAATTTSSVTKATPVQKYNNTQFLPKASNAPPSLSTSTSTSSKSSFSSPPANSSQSQFTSNKQTSPTEPNNPSKRPKLDLRPLSELARPTTLEEFYGQTQILNESKLLRTLIDQKRLPNIILWGPPGTGKTTLAKIIAKMAGSHFKELSAVTHNLEDLKKATTECVNHQKLTKSKSILFVDEIHRFTKSQQDWFLHPLEHGSFVLLAATTENPSFRLNGALLSRCRVIVLNKLEDKDIVSILKRAFTIKVKQLSPESPQIVIPAEIYATLAKNSDGDARVALNMIDMCVDFAAASFTDEFGSNYGTKPVVTLTEDMLGQILQKTTFSYDQSGEQHYNCISALHKSLRGSDVDASLYWLGRMLYSGEDPLYIARRLCRFASEDIGLADNQALLLANTTYDVVHKIGMPECDAVMAHCTAYLAKAPKSVSTYKAMNKVKAFVKSNPDFPVPLHIRNAPTSLMKDIGYGKGYMYNPDFDPNDPELKKQSYLPDEMKNVRFFED